VVSRCGQRRAQSLSAAFVGSATSGGESLNAGALWANYVAGARACWRYIYFKFG